jgi:hypothetical protein
MGRRWREIAPLAGITAVALALRLYGIEWDLGYLFHPDERQVLMVADGLRFPWPPQWRLLLTPMSPWNPHFFSYGSLPIYLLRIVSRVLGLWRSGLGNLTASYLVGRTIAALSDAGTVLLVYVLGRRLYGRGVGLVGAALTALAVLHIQLAHFYVVDSLLALFVVLALVQAVRVVQEPDLRKALALGAAWGAALACKVSAAPLLLPVTLAWSLTPTHPQARGRRGWWAAAGLGLTCLAAALTFALLEPYAVIDHATFLEDVLGQSMMASGAIDAPFTRQYIGTRPFTYLAGQTIVWGLGAPLGLAGFAGALAAPAWALFRGIRRKEWIAAAPTLVAGSWALVYFGVVGGQHAKFLRYMLPVTPLLCLWAAWGMLTLARISRPRRLARWATHALAALVIGGTALYALAYTNIYRQEHPWNAATRWLCANLPARSPILGEHWDDPLPLLQGTGELACYDRHYFTELPAYEPDDLGKLEDMITLLRGNDYLVLASNRLYDTIPRLPARYPLTARYYQLLLSGQLGFQMIYYDAVYPSLFGVDLVNDTFSDPSLPKPAMVAEREAGRRRIVLGRADESFTVYDHPQVLVFRKREVLNREQLLERFGDVVAALPSAPN